jgi:hypothetical protein
MGAIGEMTLEHVAREAAGNWRSWTCFVWGREREIDDAENWSIIYTHNRDNVLLAQSNASVIAVALKSFSETENPDVVFEPAVHSPGTLTPDSVPRLGPDTAEDTAG